MSEEESSSPRCPKCGTELKADFGYTDCSGCGVVCYIDMDDNVVVKGEDDNNEVDELEMEENLHVEVQDIVEDAYGDGVEENIDPLNEEPEEFEAEDMTLEESESEDGEEPVFKEPEVEHEQEFDEESFEEDDAVETGAEEVSAPMAAGEFLNDLEVFASSANVKDFESELYFDMKISGAEDEKVKEILIETVADSRLDLSEEMLTEDFVEEEGALYLSQIPFVRAVVIYKRILSLGLKVEWLQKEVHELEADDEIEIVDEEEAY